MTSIAVARVNLPSSVSSRSHGIYFSVYIQELVVHIKSLEGQPRRMSSGAEDLPFVYPHRMFTPGELSPRYQWRNLEHPAITDPWRGHAKHIAMKVVGTKGLYLTAYPYDTDNPFYYGH
nr:hypothetical protein BgiMline_022738 [Biomphalaria glabrata]